MRCIKELSEALTANIPEESILIVRNPEEGRRLITECAKAGNLMVGVRAATPLMLAQEICAPMPAKGNAPRLMTRGEMQDRFFQLLLEQPEEGFLSRPHVRERKTAEMLLSTIRELNREMVGPVSGNERLEAVQKFREQWQMVKGEALLDEEDLLRKAIEVVQTGQQDTYRRNTHFVVLSTENFPRLDRALIDALAKDRLHVVPVEVPVDQRVPERCVSTGIEGMPGKKVPVNRESIRFWRCRGAETEQKAMMRDILSRGRAAEDCAIVYLGGDTVPGLYAAAKVFHLPICMAEGIPMTDSTVYDVLSLVLGWKESDFNAEELRKAILSGALRMKSGRRFCREMRERNIGWGSARYELLLGENEKGYPDAETAQDWREMLSLLSEVSGQNGTLEEQRQAVSQLLHRAVGIRREEDASALAAAGDLLSQITWLEEGETVLSRLLDRMEQASAPTGGGKKGSILAVPLSQAFCTGRKYLYFCGLSRFSMQDGAVESPILLDDERLRFGLAGKRAKELETTFLFLLSLVQHEGETVLSYNDYDMERMIPLSPAPVYRSLLADGEAEAVSCVAEEPRMIGDLISTGKRVRVQPGDQSSESCHTEDGAPAFALKEGKSFRAAMEGMAFSASSLETALACPFRFYMQRLVGLYPPSIPARRNDSWLEANEMGTLCHAVLEQYYRSPEADWETVLEAEIERLKALRPVGPDSAVQADTERAKRLIRRAVAWTGNAGRQVLATEQRFGKNAGEDPLALRIGERTLRLSGSIDRVDRIEDGSLAILDYKTGGSKSYRDHLDVKLQQDLYTRAAEALNPESRVAEGGYLFLKDAADYLSVPQGEDERSRKAHTILSLLDWLEDEGRALTAAPAFVIHEDGSFCEPGSADARQKEYEKCSRYCEFAGLCPAGKQIRRAAGPEGEEVPADD